QHPVLRQAHRGPVQFPSGGGKSRSLQRPGVPFRVAALGVRVARRGGHPGGGSDERPYLAVVRQDPVDAYRALASAARNLAYTAHGLRGEHWPARTGIRYFFRSRAGTRPRSPPASSSNPSSMPTMMASATWRELS